MTLIEYFDRHPEVAVAALLFIPSMLSAIFSGLNTLRGRVTLETLQRGVAMSASNAEDVKCEVRAVRPGVKHDMENGTGTVIAQKTAEHIAPILTTGVSELKEAATSLASGVGDRVVNTAATVAADLVVKQDDDERIAKERK